MTLRVVSLNAWGGRAGSALFEWLATVRADIYCFQEVFAGPALVDKRFRDGDGHGVHVDLFGELRALLPLHQAFFSAGSRGYVNDSEWTGLDLEYGIAMFVHSQLSVVASATGLVFGEFRRAASGSPPLSRSAQVLRCAVPGGWLTVGNIHGLWHREGKHDTDARRQQARAFGALLDRISVPGDAMLACGDFNVLPDSSTFDLMGSTRWRNLVAEHAIESTRSPLYRKQPHCADYALANQGVSVQRLEVPSELLISDHCPLILDFNVVPAGTPKT